MPNNVYNINWEWTNVDLTHRYEIQLSSNWCKSYQCLASNYDNLVVNNLRWLYICTVDGISNISCCRDLRNRSSSNVQDHKNWIQFSFKAGLISISKGEIKLSHMKRQILFIIKLRSLDYMDYLYLTCHAGIGVLGTKVWFEVTYSPLSRVSSDWHRNQ